MEDEIKPTRTMSDIERRIRDLVRKQARLSRIAASIAEELGGVDLLNEIEESEELVFEEGTGSFERVVHRLDYLHEQSLYLRNVLYAIQGLPSADDEDAATDESPADEEAIEGNFADLRAKRDRLKAKVGKARPSKRRPRSASEAHAG